MKEKLLFGLPELASEHGEMVDHMLLVVTVFMAVLGVFWTVYLTYALIRFHRSRSPKAAYKGMVSHWSSHLEIGVIITECILLLGFAFPLWGARVVDERRPTGPEVERIRVVGEKFKWTFHYPGEDKAFGRVDPYLISPQNPLGIDPDDPNSADDFTSEFELHVPVGRPIHLEITAKDVIHALHLLEMRMQQDAIPGEVAHVWFTPTKTSTEDGWDILCGQLCGVGHANMAAKLFVTEESEFDTWAASKAPKPADAAPSAVAEAGGGSAAPAN